MAMKKKPVTGMKDILPGEMVLRDYLIAIIKDTYRRFGFTPMETPCVEHIENLTSKQGGDNEKLIFKILKRGEKLRIDSESTENDLADSGLRYDLTLPLTRYYANNSAVLPQPFKALQIGSVWRADRPQRGRFRQFTQCDIDILGEATNLAEIELILATTTALKTICPENAFTVRVNDRRILKAMAAWAGFPEDAADSVFITLDKMDKIGEEGVRQELMENGFAGEAADKYLSSAGKAGERTLMRSAPEGDPRRMSGGRNLRKSRGDHGDGDRLRRRRLRAGVRPDPGARHGLLHRHHLRSFHGRLRRQRRRRRTL